MPTLGDLYRAVGRLALPAVDQLAYLARIGVGDLADELAMDLDDVLGFSGALDLAPKEVRLLTALSELLGFMSGPGQELLWRSEGLRGDSRWERVRGLAKEFLFLEPGPTSPRVLAEGWVWRVNARAFISHVAIVAGYGFDDLDWAGVEAGLPDTDHDAGGWFTYPIAGARSFEVAMAKDVGGDELMVRVTGLPDAILTARLQTVTQLLSD